MACQLGGESLKAQRSIRYLLPFLAVVVLSANFADAVASDPRASSSISSDEFLASDFAKHFTRGRYQDALAAADALVAAHPGDPLVLRYRALTLEKLGRYPEAIAAYRQILSAHPDHVPTHLFLGMAYAKAGQRDEAAQELDWVVARSDSDEYRHWAQAQLNRLYRGGRRAARRITQRPYLVGKTRLAYDSNPLLIPNDKRLTSRSREDGVRLALDLDVGYPVVLTEDRRLDVVYVGRQTFHGGDTDALDFTSQGVALDAKQRRFVGSRAVLFGSRYDIRANFLRSDLFSVIHRLIVSAESSFSKRTRTHGYGRVSYSNYGPDGSSPDRSSRDGVRGGVGVVQYFYAADVRTYVFVKGEVSAAQTRGDNYDREGFLARLGVHAPLQWLRATDLDASVGFDWGAYPEFSSLSLLEPVERRDARLDTYVSVTYHWKPDLATRGFYRFINSDNRNDFFDRNRHIVGVEMVFSL